MTFTDKKFGEIKQPKTLKQPQKLRASHFKRGRKSICVSQPLSIGDKRQKFTFAQSKRFPSKHNLPVKENNSLEQEAFWHEVKVVCNAYRTPLFYTKYVLLSTINYYYCSIEHCLLLLSYFFTISVFVHFLLFKKKVSMDPVFEIITDQSSTACCCFSVFVHFSLFKKRCPWTKSMKVVLGLAPNKSLRGTQ